MQDLVTEFTFRWDDDAFITRTIGECEELFEEHCEQKVEQFRMVSAKEKLSILRSCIELLNRLDGTLHKQFAGRVLIFLARTMPLYDRSGTNPMSEFRPKEQPLSVKSNLQKIKERSEEKIKKIAQTTNCDIEEGETISDDDSDNSSSNSDFSTNLYEKFWRAQEYLSLPNKLYDKNNWLVFRCAIDILVLEFERKPISFRVWKPTYPFMTEPKSFALQLNDLNFRRCFLLQILIGLQYFDVPVNSRPDHYVLDKLQCNWLSVVTKRIFTLLGTMPNVQEGREFLGLATQILKTEEMWNKWKNEKCQEPVRPLDDGEDFINMGSTYSKRRKVSDELRNAKQYNLQSIGSKEMTKLWNRQPDPSIFTQPDLNNYFKIPEEKQMETFKDPNKSFRILRLLRKSPHFFVPAAAVIQNTDGYLKSLADKHFNV